jgi:23S rRNA pseudouridine2605 synthase
MRDFQSSRGNSDRSEGRRNSDNRSGSGRSSYGNNDRRSSFSGGDRQRSNGDSRFGEKRSFNSDRPSRSFGERREDGRTDRSSGGFNRKPYNSDRTPRPYTDRREGGAYGGGASRRPIPFREQRDGNSELNSNMPNKGRFVDRADRVAGSNDRYWEKKERQDPDFNGKKISLNSSDNQFDTSNNGEGLKKRRPRISKNTTTGSSAPQQSSGTKWESAFKPDQPIRLNKYIANSGICSRREADELISAGLVSVNGVVVSELGSKILPTDEIKYNGEKLREERKVYILLNKPKDFVTTLDDPNARRTVMELVASACRERVYPVGRLDRQTTGVLLLTNDGELTKTLTHPKYEKKKIYEVTLDKKVTHADLEKIVEGIELEDGVIRADAVAYASDDDKKTVGIELHSGKNRIVRRIFESLGYKVNKLDRVYFAGLTKKGMKRGQWRFLTEKEVTMLKMGSYE